MSLLFFFYIYIFRQSWESVAAVDNAVVNAILCGIYNSKKIAVVMFSVSVVFTFITKIIDDYF